MGILVELKGQWHEVTQKEDDWCIPAGVELLLKYAGVFCIEQERLVQEHLGMCGGESPKYKTYERVANRLLLTVPGGASCFLTFHDFAPQEDALRHVFNALVADRPVLVSERAPDGFHSCVVCGYDSKSKDLHVWDPGAGIYRIIMAENLRPCLDLLVGAPSGSMPSS